MSGYLADTNVLSEPARPRPNARVLAWLERHESELYTSAFTIAEIAFGIAALPSGRKKKNLQRELQELLTRMEGRVLPFNKRVALEWGEMQAELRCAGRLMPLENSLIAATARRYGLVTPLGKLLDPLADKLLVVSALIMLGSMNRQPGIPGSSLLGVRHEGEVPPEGPFLGSEKPPLI